MNEQEAVFADCVITEKIIRWSLRAESDFRLDLEQDPTHRGNHWYRTNASSGFYVGSLNFLREGELAML